jgi:hypothetical protein
MLAEIARGMSVAASGMSGCAKALSAALVPDKPSDQCAPPSRQGARGQDAKEPNLADAGQAAAVAAKPATVTKEALQDAMVAKARDGKDVRALLARRGYDRLSAVPSGEYAGLLAETEAL